MDDLPPDDRRAGLSPPQFGLSTLMLLVAVAAMVFALADVLGPYGTFWLVVFVLAVMGHMAGNALGTQLRERGDRPLIDESGRLPSRPRPPERIDYAPATGLSRRTALGLPMLLATILGTVGGGAAGGYWLARSMWPEINVAAIGVAVLAFAALGGIWSFLAWSFLQVAWGALRGR